MKGFGITLFMMISWILVLTLAYCQLKDNYNESTAEVEQLHETVKTYKQDLEHFVEVYSDRASKELAEYKNETEHSLLVYEQMYEAKIKGLMEEW